MKKLRMEINNFHLAQIKKQGKEQELLYILEEHFDRPHQYRFDDRDIVAFVYSDLEGNPGARGFANKKRQACSD